MIPNIIPNIKATMGCIPLRLVVSAIKIFSCAHKNAEIFAHHMATFSPL
jgi:hypothetical protein